MSSDNEVLYLVKRVSTFSDSPDKYWLFRTREAARQFKKDRKDPYKYDYTVIKTAWGPEQ